MSIFSACGLQDRRWNFILGHDEKGVPDIVHVLLCVCMVADILHRASSIDRYPKLHPPRSRGVRGRKRLCMVCKGEMAMSA